MPTIWVQPLGRHWQSLGTGTDRGVWHEDLVAVSDQWGPKSATFTLRRLTRAAFPDLLARTPVVIEEAGVRVWAGRIKEAPEQGGRDRQITVQCVGGQSILDDDTLERILVHTDLTAYKDVRSILSGDLTIMRAYGQVSNDSGVITLMTPKDTIVPAVTAVGVTFDAGPGNAIKRVVATVDSSNNTANTNFSIIGSDAPWWNDASRADYVTGVVNNTFSSTTVAGTASAAKRYVTLLLFNSAGFTAAADIWFRFKAVQAFADTAYESGNASILTAKMIITDALSRATTGLSTDLSGIGDPTFSFPSFAADQPRSPRELIAAANAPISQWTFKIDEYLRPIYKARSTVPVVELGAWLGSEADNASINNDEGVVTKVTVRGQGSDGSAIRSTATQTGTVVDRQGGVAAMTLDASYTLTSTSADKLRDAYLVSHRVSPFKGQNTLGLSARRVTGGAYVHPAHLLLLTGELARRNDLVDPDTQALGRTAVIDQVTYRATPCTSDLDLDNTRRDFEALNERMGLLAPV